MSDMHTSGSNGRSHDAAGGARDMGHAASSMARDAAEQAKRQARTMVDDQKRRAADQLDGVARALRRTAGNLDDENQNALGMVAERAAEQVERLGHAMRERNVEDAVAELEAFARRRPEIVIGGAVAAGLMLARFLKSSSERRREDYERRSYAPELSGYGSPDYGDARRQAEGGTGWAAGASGASSSTAKSTGASSSAGGARGATGSSSGLGGESRAATRSETSPTATDPTASGGSASSGAKTGSATGAGYGAAAGSPSGHAVGHGSPSEATGVSTSGDIESHSAEARGKSAAKKDEEKKK